MIFVFLFGLIAIVVMCLSFYDTHNLNLIRHYYEQNQCKPYYEYHGKFIGICNNNLIEFDNHFSIDLNTPEYNISIKNIKTKEKIIKNKQIFMKLDYGNNTLFYEFENEMDLDNFVKNL
jgi:hypothetical protein